MLRMPRVGLVFVVAALVALLVAPMAGARTVGSTSIRLTDSDWVDGALSWAQNLVGIRHAGHRGRSVTQDLNQKDGTPSSTQGGGCITPDGRPRPLCDV